MSDRRLTPELLLGAYAAGVFPMAERRDEIVKSFGEKEEVQLKEFSEKPQAAEGWINGAFFVLEPEVADYIEGDDTLFEREPLERLAKDGELMAFRHEGFWQCMDTLRDRVRLEEFWQSGAAPWAVRS